MSVRILTVQDISCVGQCSMTVALPILSACGHEVCILPTAVLSTHTGGFSGWTFRDLTDDIQAISDHWLEEKIVFDGIATGYLGSFEQIDLMKEMFMISKEKGYRHFFYGSTQNTIYDMRRALERDYPGMTIAGMYSPPFRPLTEEEDRKIIEMINSANADFVWVGLGAPKQERWMYEHRNKINAVMLGVGAGFDYFAGYIKRAPKWMQALSLEWFYRLLQDPMRLWNRYITTNIKFLKLIRKEKNNK